MRDEWFRYKNFEKYFPEAMATTKRLNDKWILKHNQKFLDIPESWEIFENHLEASKDGFEWMANIKRKMTFYGEISFSTSNYNYKNLKTYITHIGGEIKKKRNPEKQTIERAVLGVKLKE